MVVCKYFLEGNCRFEQNCRFEHTYPVAGTQGGQYAGVQGGLPVKQVWKMMEQEVIASEKGKQWPLSCFAVFKEGHCYPGCEDISPEEVRWLMYQARLNGNVEQCAAQIQQLNKIAEQKRNEIKHPTQETYNIIGKLSEDKLRFDQSSMNNTSIFRSQQPQASNIFGGASFGSTPQQQNIFGGSTSTNIFNTGQQQPTTNMFSSTQHNVFSSPPATNMFGGTTSQNMFGTVQPQLSTTNLFSSDPAPNVFTTNPNLFSNTPQTSFKFEVQQPAPAQSQPSNMFQTQSIFQTTQNSTPNANVFSGTTAANVLGGTTTTANVLGGTTTASNVFSPTTMASKPPVSNPFQRPPVVEQRDPNNYTNMEELTQDEKEQFQASRFSYGKIPLQPPPMQCCFTD